MQYKRHSFLSRIIWAVGILPLMMFGISAHAESLATAKNTVMVTPKFDFSSVINARQKALDHRVVFFSNVGSSSGIMDDGGRDTSGKGGDSSHDGGKDTSGHHDGGKDTSGHDGGKDTSSHHGQDSTGTSDSSSHHGQDSTSKGDRDSSSTSDSTSHGDKDSSSHGDRDTTSDSSHHGRDTVSNGGHHHRDLDSMFRATKDSLEHHRDSLIIGHLDSLFNDKDSDHIGHRDSLGTGDSDSTSDSSHIGRGDSTSHGDHDTVRFHNIHGNRDSLFRSRKDSIQHVRDSSIIGHLDSLFQLRDSLEDGRHGGDSGHHHVVNPGNNGNGALGKNAGAIPTSVVLNQNYPNPFQSNTSIEYALPYSEDVTITVYSLAGQKVVTLTAGVQNAGSHNVTFDASSISGGMYFYTIRTGDGTVKTLRMIVTK